MSTEPIGTSGASSLLSSSSSSLASSASSSLTSLSLSSSSSSSSSQIPTRFIWPHGGLRVFLCGSFTGWHKMIQMLPMEGCPSVFQAVIPLAPDSYQFKFIVDGEWRHDEQQQIVIDTTGNCNNYLVVKEVEREATARGVGQGNMEVEDGDAHSQKLPLEGIDSASQRIIDNFLNNHTVYEILPDSGKVVALDISMPIKQAFHVLYEQGIPLAPLWDSDQQQFVGMLTASDFVEILVQLGSQRATLSEEELETHTIAAWKDGKIRSKEKMLRGRCLHYVTSDDSLKEVAQKLLHHQVTTVPVLHFPAQEENLPQLLHLATLSDVLKCVCRHFQHSLGSLPLLNQPIGSLPLGTWRGDSPNQQLAVLRATSPLSTALAVLNQAGVSSIPIVDENGSLVDVYARSDIIALARDNTYVHVQLQHLTVEQALQLMHDGRSSVGTTPVLRCQMCLRTDALQVILERLAIPGVRRIICVEAGSRQIEGIITLSDVFKFLLS